tara:strand:+ start:749 stop:1159 length:411 start_codon:yes stop_codon:yes gene_type:complete
VLTDEKDIYQLMESKMKKLNMAQKAKKAGLPAQTVYNRMHNGWSEKKALSVPNGKYKKGKVKSKDNQLWGTEARKKKTAPYKVEPKKVQASGSRVKKPIIPLPIEKFEAPKNDNGMYIAIGLVALALMLVVAIAQN